MSDGVKLVTFPDKILIGPPKLEGNISSGGLRRDWNNYLKLSFKTIQVRPPRDTHVTTLSYLMLFYFRDKITKLIFWVRFFFPFSTVLSLLLYW